MKENQPDHYIIGEIITQDEATLLFKYVAGQTVGCAHIHIVDWLGTQPQILKRMTDRGLLLSFFAYQVEYAIGQTLKKDER